MEHLSIGPQEEDSPLLSLPDELLLQVRSTHPLAGARPDDRACIADDR